MAKNKKEQLKPQVAPSIGKKYNFDFAGSICFGPIVSKCDSLSELHGYEYYWMTNDLDTFSNKKSMYPISIYNISKNRENV
jgi:hypothetical protein